MQANILFNKPFGVLSQFSAGRASDASSPHRPTLRDFIPARDVYPAGRLDHDSEGLLLLTADGWLQHLLTDPRYGHPRTYWAQVEGRPEEWALEALRTGVMIQGRRTLPAEARVIAEPELWERQPPIRRRAAIPTAWIELTLREGRNRQVRRMTAAVGLPTLRLVRVAIGPLRLDGLAPGQWRWLTASESKRLREFARQARPLAAAGERPMARELR